MRGDYFNVARPDGGVLLFMCAAPCQSINGVITVPIVNRLRMNLASGVAVTTSKPYSYFNLVSYVPVSYVREMAMEVPMEFREVNP
jgi:hypothetical protein